MAILKFTKRNLDALKHRTEQREYWDSQTPGFGLRVGSLTKRYMVRFKTPGVDGVAGRLTIYDYKGATLAQARRVAQRHLAAAAEGIDPRRL